MPKALGLVTEVMAALQATLGDDHPNTMVAANNLACYLRAIGRLPEALSLTEETLRRDAASSRRSAPAYPLRRGQPGQLPRRFGNT